MAAAEDAVFPDDIEGRRCSKIHGDDRQRIMCGGPGCINEAVAAYFSGSGMENVMPEITFGCDEQRFCAEQITDTFLQKRQNRRNNAGNDDAPKVGRERFLSSKSCSIRRFILAGRPGVVDVNPGCEFEGIRLLRCDPDAAERNGCVPDING